MKDLNQDINVGLQDFHEVRKKGNVEWDQLFAEKNYNPTTKRIDYTPRYPDYYYSHPSYAKIPVEQDLSHPPQYNIAKLFAANIGGQYSEKKDSKGQTTLYSYITENKQTNVERIFGFPDNEKLKPCSIEFGWITLNFANQDLFITAYENLEKFNYYINENEKNKGKYLKAYAKQYNGEYTITIPAENAQYFLVDVLGFYPPDANTEKKKNRGYNKFCRDMSRVQEWAAQGLLGEMDRKGMVAKEGQSLNHWQIGRDTYNFVKNSICAIDASNAIPVSVLQKIINRKDNKDFFTTPVKVEEWFADLNTDISTKAAEEKEGEESLILTSKNEPTEKRKKAGLFDKFVSAGKDIIETAKNTKITNLANEFNKATFSVKEDGWLTIEQATVILAKHLAPQYGKVNEIIEQCKIKLLHDNYVELMSNNTLSDEQKNVLRTRVQSFSKHDPEFNNYISGLLGVKLLELENINNINKENYNAGKTGQLLDKTSLNNEITELCLLASQPSKALLKSLQYVLDDVYNITDVDKKKDITPEQKEKSKILLNHLTEVLSYLNYETADANTINRLFKETPELLDDLINNFTNDKTGSLTGANKEPKPLWHHNLISINLSGPEIQPDRKAFATKAAEKLLSGYCKNVSEKDISTFVQMLKDSYPVCYSMVNDVKDNHFATETNCKNFILSSSRKMVYDTVGTIHSRDPEFFTKRLYDEARIIANFRQELKKACANGKLPNMGENSEFLKTLEKCELDLSVAYYKDLHTFYTPNAQTYEEDKKQIGEYKQRISSHIQLSNLFDEKIKEEIIRIEKNAVEYIAPSFDKPSEIIVPSNNDNALATKGYDKADLKIIVPTTTERKNGNFLGNSTRTVKINTTPTISFSFTNEQNNNLPSVSKPQTSGYTTSSTVTCSTTNVTLDTSKSTTNSSNSGSSSEERNKGLTELQERAIEFFSNNNQNNDYNKYRTTRDRFHNNPTINSSANNINKPTGYTQQHTTQQTASQRAVLSKQQIMEIKK